MVAELPDFEAIVMSAARSARAEGLPELTLSSELSHAGLDSLRMTYAIMEIEESLPEGITDEAFEALGNAITVGDVVDILRDRYAEPVR